MLQTGSSLLPTVFPGIEDFVKKHDQPVLAYTDNTNGKSLNILFISKTTENAYAKDSAAVTKYGFHESKFSSFDYRYYKQ